MLQLKVVPLISEICNTSKNLNGIFLGKRGIYEHKKDKLHRSMDNFHQT